MAIGNSLPPLIPQPRLAIRASGMVCAVGASGPAAFPAVFNRMNRFEEIPFRDSNNKLIMGAPATEAAVGRQGIRRLATFLAMSVDECLSSWPRSSEPWPPLLVCTGEATRPDFEPDLASRLLEEVQQQLGVVFPKPSGVMLSDRCGFFERLEAARALLASGQHKACVVAGVDSFLNRKMLRWMEQQRRLRIVGAVEGVIPGEAAAAVCVQLPGARDAKAEIHGVGFGVDPSGKDASQLNTGRGLADAIQNALKSSNMPIEQLDLRLGGMTTESEYKEASLGFSRIMRTKRRRFDWLTIYESLGDVGAAMPACMTALFVAGGSKAYFEGTKAIMVGLSDTAKRSACVLTLPVRS